MFDPFELESDLGDRQLGSIAGDVRIGATGTQSVFVGIGPGDDVESYLAGVESPTRSLRKGSIGL